MLTKTDFLLYLDAPMHLWAKAHEALEARTLTPYQQHLIQQGQQVETLARQYLEKIVFSEYARAQFLWQPTYNDGRYEARVDALIFDQEADAYDLYEIKSSTSVHTDHELDVTFQVLLLEDRLNLRHIHLLHIDKTYNHREALDLKGFFTVEEISEQVDQRREAVTKWRQEAALVMQMEEPAPGFACTKPRSCPCPALCHPDLPDRPIYDIPYIGKKAVTLREQGITAIQDIPEDFNLSEKQQKHRRAVKTQQPVIDHQAIRQSLERLHFPLYFLDYETFNPAVPLYPGYHPYQHIVFQYSLFVLATPDSDPQHYDFLFTENSDPASRLVPHLVDHLGPAGSVLVWNQSFEAQRNKELADHLPEYAERLLGINDRLYDLMLVFKEGHYVHRDFHGSASLKAVLPVLCPDLGYDKLEISDGEQAMLTWYMIQQGNFTSDEITGIEQALRDYCRQDTFGMVAIWEHLCQL